MNNNQDIFKLVEEMEKNKKKTSLDDIYSELDSIKDGKDVTIDKVEPTNADTSIQSSSSSPRVVIKPSIPNHIGDYDTRFDCFKAIIEHINYGENNSLDYVKGHKTALEKYFKDAYNNQKDLYVVQARVNDEINKFTNKNDLVSRGYYDGLYYVYLALLRSKELLIEKLTDIMSKKLK